MGIVFPLGFFTYTVLLYLAYKAVNDNLGSTNAITREYNDAMAQEYGHLCALYAFFFIMRAQTSAIWTADMKPKEEKSV